MDWKNRLSLIVSAVFIILVLLTGVMMNYVKFKKTETSSLENQFRKDTPDLYSEVDVELDSPMLIRARFYEIKDLSLYVEYYYNEGRGVGDPTKPAVKEAIPLMEKTVYDCVERFVSFKDGSKIDRFNMYLDTRNFTGENLPEGRDLEWFRQNVKIGEAVEVRFIETDKERVAGLVLLYKDKCEK